VYFSSFADATLHNAEELVERIVADRRLNEESLAVEVASNDGYLLQFYQRHGVPVLGIEPAANIARVAEERGIPTRSEFFGDELADELRTSGLGADVLHANNVLAHVADLNGFVEGIAAVLKEDGVAVVEVPYVYDLIDRTEFDTIYHEHLCYFSLTALTFLFHRHNLAVIDVERIAIHGGSLRLYAALENAATQAVSERVGGLLAEEQRRGGTSYAFYQDFGAHVEVLRRQLMARLRALKAEGRSIAAYGASAKGSTLLNYCRIGSDILDFVVDRSTAKHGLYTPGSHLLISPPDRLLQEQPDFLLLLAWNFSDEIIRQQHEYVERGGQFVIPIPTVRTVGRDVTVMLQP
jgi:SAM-dependent methyltransferase